MVGEAIERLTLTLTKILGRILFYFGSQQSCSHFVMRRIAREVITVCAIVQRTTSYSSSKNFSTHHHGRQEALLS